MFVRPAAYLHAPVAGLHAPVAGLHAPVVLIWPARWQSRPVRLARPARLADQLPAGSWAMAMGCGIVSIDLFLDGWLAASDVLLWLAAAVWAVLVVRWATAPACAVREASSPQAGAVAQRTTS